MMLTNTSELWDHRAVTATEHVHGWRIVQRPPDIKASCEMSESFPTNKQSRTNSDLSTRIQEAGGWCHHPYYILQISYDRRGDLASTGRQPLSLAPTVQWDVTN